MSTSSMARLPTRLRLIVVNSLLLAHWFPPSLRPPLMRALGMRIGRVRMLSGSVVRTLSLSLGDGCFIHHGCLFDSGEITLGTDVYVSSGVTFVTGDHELGGPEKRAGADLHRPVRIGDGSWLGANVVVLSGVTVAPGCIIGAGAVVTKDTDPDGVYVGVPARRTRTLPTEQA